MTISGSARRGAETLAVAVLYFGAARLGLALAFHAEQVSAVWPPSGIALAAVLLLGPRIAPAIWLGAFAANAIARETLPVAAVIAAGNTAEALAGVWLVHRLGGAGVRLDSLRAVRGLFAAALLSTVVSAAVGVTALCAGGVRAWTEFGELWVRWWVGDAMGDLLVAPALLALAGARPQGRTVIMAVPLFLGLLVLGLIVFGTSTTALPPYLPRAYAFFPFVIAASLLLGPRGSALLVFTAAAVAVPGTAAGGGPFATGSMADLGLDDRLLMLDLFLGILASMGLVVSAALAERDALSRLRATDQAVTQVLGSAQSLEEASARILPVVCEGLRWDLGAVWTPAGSGPEQPPGAGGDDVLRCVAFWRRPGMTAPTFEADSRARTFARGEGLPGAVWENGQPRWVPDMATHPAYPRSPIAARERIHAGFAFPILLAPEVLGVIEFFSREIRDPDPAVLAAFAGIGSQTGQFAGRRRAEGEQRRAEQALRRTVAEIAAIIETALDAIVGIDLEGRITGWNPRAEAIFGWSRAEALGRSFADLVLPARDREAHARDRSLFLSTGAGPLLDRRVEVGALRRDGSEFPMELSVTAVTAPDGLAFSAFAADISERHRLLQAERSAREEAEHASRLKDEFLATLSHELRTPLNSILGWATVIRDTDATEDMRKRGMEVIERNARQQARLIEDLLDVSRIIRGKLSIEVQVVDLGAALESALETVRPALDAKKLALSVRLGTGLLVGGDPGRLQQIAWNLLSNAVKFTPTGGQITVAVERTARDVELTVGDSGEGIDPAFLPRLFDRFAQADSSVTRRHGGLGLGLAIVRHLCELHGGSVQAESAGRGAGSRFTVRLPALGAREAKLTARSHPAASEGLLADVRVLVVDDDQDTRSLMETVLEAQGAHVLTAATAAEALALLPPQRPHVLVADIGMPNEDGLSLMRRVRLLPVAEGGALPAVALTAHASPQDREAALACGFQVLVAKPADPAELVRVVAQLAAGAVR